MKTSAIRNLSHHAADLASEILAAAVVEYGDEGMLAKFICPPSFETAVRKAAGIGEVNGAARAELDAITERLTALEAENAAKDEALRKIASCDSVAKGDVVDIARTALSPPTGKVQEDLFYLQDTRQTWGNCAAWWKPEGAGYTDNLDEAAVYTEEDLPRTLRGTDAPRKKADIDAVAQRHVRVDYPMSPLLKD